MDRLTNLLRTRAVHDLKGVMDRLNHFDWEGEYEKNTRLYGPSFETTYDEESKHFVEDGLRQEECLRQYVDTWLSAKWQFLKWVRTNTEMWKQFSEDLRRHRSSVSRDAQGDPRLGVDMLDAFNTDRWAETKAAWDFAQLITSPLRDRIRRCQSCGRYFLNVTGYERKAYCTRSCGKDFTARIGTRERRRRDHQKKLDAARRVLNRLARRRRAGAIPKQQVCDFASTKGLVVTKQWLTRAINRRDLLVPAGLKLIPSEAYDQGHRHLRAAVQNRRRSTAKR